MSYEIFVNPAVGPLAADTITGPEPIEFHRLMPGYAETPLLDCPAIARRLGVARVLVKDESSRLGLPSFKMLGASWAVASAVRRQWLGEAGAGDAVLSPAEIRALIPQPETRRLVAATDGNHGRGVARMAKLLAVACTIYVPRGTAASRIADIESEGATVVVVDGSYDDAIAVSARDADTSTIVVSDTSWEGYIEIPRSVGRGYSTLFLEIDEALARSGNDALDVVAFQAGVGSFAAAGLVHYRAGAPEVSPTTVIVEPLSADCLLASARAGGITEAPGPHNSTMAGLNCGLPSQLAWPVISRTVDVFLGIEDEWANAGMRLLAESGIVSGESGAASLGGLLAVAELGGGTDRALTGMLPGATVLIINTEGATDPLNYETVVGLAPAIVVAEKQGRRAEAGVVAL